MSKLLGIYKVIQLLFNFFILLNFLTSVQLQFYIWFRLTLYFKIRRWKCVLRVCMFMCLVSFAWDICGGILNHNKLSIDESVPYF